MFQFHDFQLKVYCPYVIKFHLAESIRVNVISNYPGIGEAGKICLIKQYCEKIMYELKFIISHIIWDMIYMGHVYSHGVYILHDYIYIYILLSAHFHMDDSTKTLAEMH